MISFPCRLVVRSIGLAAVLSMVTAHAATAQYYTVSSVGAAGDPHAAALNDAGQVAGNFNPPGSSGQHPFLANPAAHTFVDLGTLPGGSSAEARALNIAGQVVGSGYVTGGFSHAFVYSTSTACPALPCLNDLGTFGGPHSAALAINASGDVVGWADDAVYGAHAFLYHAGMMTDLNTLIPASMTGWALFEAQAINDAGQIAGLAFREGSCACSEVVGFLYTPETAPGAGDATLVEIKDALSPGTFPVAEVTGINAAGRVIGTYLAPDLVNSQAFVFDPATSTVTSLSLGGSYSRPEAINASGQVVGYSAPASPLFYLHAFLYSTTPACPVACLVDLTPTALVATSTAINAAGDLLIDVAPALGMPAPQLSLYSSSTGTSVDLTAAAFSACSQWSPGSVSLLNNLGQITGEGFFTSGAWNGLFLLDPSPVPGTEIQQSSVYMSYGGTVALRPRLMTGCAGVEGQTLTLTINGVSVGSAVTDAGGFALFNNAIGALNVGEYPSAIVVQFAGAPSYPASTTVVDLFIHQASAHIDWPTPAPIAQGTPLSTTQLNATSPVVLGTLTYTPPAGTILTGGNHQLQVLFEPANPTNVTSAVATVLLNVIPSNSAQPSYTIDAIPDLPNVACPPNTQPAAMNAAGHAVGFSSVDCNNHHAFTYANGVTTDLGTAGANSSEGTFISNSDKVAGQLFFADSSTHAFMHDGVSMHDLGTLGGSQAGPHALNEAGDVVGFSFGGFPGGVFAFLSQGGAPMVTLDSLLSPADAAHWVRLESGLGINDAVPFRQIAGMGIYRESAMSQQSRAFVATLSADGHAILSISKIGPDSACFSDATVVESFSMNASGQVAGAYFPNCFSSQIHSFLYTPAHGPQPETFVDLTPSAQFSQPVNLNASGQVLLRADGLAHIFTPSPAGGTLNEIGTINVSGVAGRALNDAGDAVGGGGAPFIFTGGAIRSLADIMGTECQWLLSDAVGLNNAGQILGKGSLLSIALGFPLPRAFVMTPASFPPQDTFVNVEHAGALFGGFSAFLTAELRTYPRDPVYAQYFQDTFGFCPVNDRTLHFSVAGGPDMPRTTSFGTAVAEVSLAGMSAGDYPTEVQFFGDSVFNASSGTGDLAIDRVAATVVWHTVAISKTTPLGSAQLNAVVYGVDSLPLPGTYVYTPPLGTLLPPGQHTLHLEFTPADTVNYFSPVVEERAVLVTLLDVPCAPLVPCGLNLTGIPDLGGSQLEASVLNASGGAAGWVTNADDEQQHAIRYSAGVTTDLGVPLDEAGDPESSFGYGLNDAGTVVGSQGPSCCQGRATYWPISGGVTELEPPSFDEYAEADFINASGHATGYERRPDFSFTSFLYDGNGGPLVFFGDLGGDSSYPTGINRFSDVVVGDSRTADFVSHAFLYDSGTTYDLGTLLPDDPDAYSYTVGISDAGDVAGESCVADCNHFYATYHAFFYEHTGGPGSPLIDLHTLGTPPTLGDPNANSHSVSISHSGAVVGSFERAPYDGSQDHAFLYRNGVVTDLGSLGGDYSTPCDFYGYYSDCVNASGQAIGYTTTPDNSFVPFVYANGTMYDLNTLLPPGSPWIIVEVRAINDAGQILGVGCRSDLGEGFDFQCPAGSVRRMFVSGPIGAAFNGSPLAVANVVSPVAPNVEATDPSGAIVHLSSAGSSDPDAGDTLTFTWTGPFGTATGADVHVPLTFGTSMVTLTIDDGHGHVASADVFPSVVDTTAPTLDFSAAPAPVPGTSPGGAIVTFTITASDLVDVTDPVNCIPGSGSLFPIGDTTVHCRSRDAHDNRATGTFVVSVLAVNSPPMCAAATPSLNVLWPADHRMVPISIAVPDADVADVVNVTITGIYSDEPTNNEGIAATSVDGGYAGACSPLLGIACTPGIAYVRAERGTPKPPASNGRVYHIQFSATDGHSPACSGSVIVTAPSALTVPAIDNLVQCNSTVANRVCAP